MAKIVKNIEELVGRTPLFEFEKFEEKHDIKAHLLGKLEYFNPSGSIKDRAALNMIKKAEEDGILHPGDTIVENTSGNTGIGLAAFSASRGYKLTVFLEPGQSEERQKMLRAYGADLKSMFDVPGVPEAFANGTFTTGFYQEAIQKYCDAQPTHHYFINQLANEANPGVHYATTGPEIWEDTDGKVDILVATSGTAGTITGLTKYFREKNPDVKMLPYRQIRPQDLVVPKIRRPLTALRHLAIRVSRMLQRHHLLSDLITMNILMSKAKMRMLLAAKLHRRMVCFWDSLPVQHCTQQLLLPKDRKMPAKILLLFWQITE